MDASAHMLATASSIYARAGASDPKAAERPPIFRIIGIILAVSSGAFIGTSFVIKKLGLLKANEKYNEVAGEGYGYLKNLWWWAGMTLMIIGEILNFVAYAFTDAILVTPLGALSVVIATVLSAIFLKERLSLVGKVGCFLCVVGSLVIVLNAPKSSAVANIQQMQDFVIAPGFLSYAGVIIVGSTIAAFYAGPRWGKKNMLVYISICSWVGGLSVVAIQGLGAAIIAQAGGTPQFNQWFLYVLLVFVIATLLTEIIYLNKALNLFNAALVTPTYYVYFTTTTIISSIVLFRGFKGTPVQIITMVNGFLTICAGVVLLQLSKSAKDVPDTAVFKGDLDQIQTIAEQQEPETEPKADAIRGTAAIVRRLSQTRQKWEAEEFKRLRQEKMQEQLEPVGEDGPIYEWDGLRRRRTIINRSPGSPMRSSTMPLPNQFGVPPPTPHPPLGMSHFPTEEELAERDRDVIRTPSILSSIAGTIRHRARTLGSPSRSEFPDNKLRSPMHPVPLTEIGVNPGETALYPGSQDHGYGLPSQGSEYRGADGMLAVPSASGSGDSSPRRQFSFQNLFRRQHSPLPTDEVPPVPPPHGTRLASSRGYSSQHAKSATEEERLGLVKGDSRMSSFPQYREEDEEGYNAFTDEKAQALISSTPPKADPSRYGRGITTPPRRGSDGREDEGSVAEYEARRQRFRENRSRSGSGSGSGSGSQSIPPPLPADRNRPAPGGQSGAFI